jgi:predicted transposase YbfD/YdcC
MVSTKGRQNCNDVFSKLKFVVAFLIYMKIALMSIQLSLVSKEALVCGKVCKELHREAGADKDTYVTLFQVVDAFHPEITVG